MTKFQLMMHFWKIRLKMKNSVQDPPIIGFSFGRRCLYSKSSSKSCLPHQNIGAPWGIQIKDLQSADSECWRILNAGFYVKISFHKTHEERTNFIAKWRVKLSKVTHVCFLFEINYWKVINRVKYSTQGDSECYQIHILPASRLDKIWDSTSPSPSLYPLMCYRTLKYWMTVVLSCGSDILQNL